MTTADSWVVVGLDNGGNKNNATVLDAEGRYLVSQLFERPSRVTEGPQVALPVVVAEEVGDDHGHAPPPGSAGHQLDRASQVSCLALDGLGAESGEQRGGVGRTSPGGEHLRSRAIAIGGGSSRPHSIPAGRGEQGEGPSRRPGDLVLGGETGAESDAR